MGSLGTVVDKLTEFFTQSFLIASYFPVLIFLAANALGTYALSAGFRQWLGEGDATQLSVEGLEVLLAAAVGAYVLSTANGALREALETLPFMPERWTRASTARQTMARATLLSGLTTQRRERREHIRSTEAWTTALDAARSEGLKLSECTYTPIDPLNEVVDLVELRIVPPRDLIETAVRELTNQLRSNNVECGSAAGSLTDDAKNLDEAEVRLRRALRDTPGLIDTQAVRLYNQIQFNYARTGTVGPTRLGNIALSVQDYFSSRYHLNFSFFWTRIQKALAQEKLLDVLTLAKAQLEFHIAMVWLSVVFGAIWIPLSAWSGFSLTLFLACALGVPVAAWVFYELAVHSYRAYADLLRTTVDLYHFDLMAALRLNLPASSNDERALWKEVGQWLDQGDYLDVLYKHPADPSLPTVP